jgi:hypothetical protein
LISPDNWNSDFFTTIQKPDGRRIQLDLSYDYRANVALYPKWQSFLYNTSVVSTSTPLEHRSAYTAKTSSSFCRSIGLER